MARLDTMERWEREEMEETLEHTYEVLISYDEWKERFHESVDQCLASFDNYGEALEYFNEYSSERCRTIELAECDQATGEFRWLESREI